MTRCLALGSALTRSSCCWIFGAGPRFLGAGLADGLLATPISASMVRPSVWARAGSMAMVKGVRSCFLHPA